MKLLRAGAAGFVVALFLVIVAGDALAQRGNTDPVPDMTQGEFFDVECPHCKTKMEVRETATSATCPRCDKVLTVMKKGGIMTVQLVEENKWKKPVLIGGGILLVLGLIGMVLKRTILAPLPVKKKKKMRRDDDDDDRPRKMRPAVVEDDDAPRPKKKKPMIIEDDEDDAPPPKRKPPR